MYFWYHSNPLKPSDLLSSLIALVVGILLYRASRSAAGASREAARATAEATKLARAFNDCRSAIELREQYISLYSIRRGFMDFRAWLELFDEQPGLAADTVRFIENLPRNLAMDVMGISDSAVVSLIISKCNRFAANAGRMTGKLPREEVKRLVGILLPQIARAEEIIEESQKNVVNKLNPS